MELLPTRFDAWIAALSSGYLSLEAFVAWADARIVADPHQPRWVLDLSLARDADEAERTLRLEWSRRAEDPTSGVPPIREPTALHVGFLYLACAAGRMSMAQMLREAGECADGAGGDDVPKCEA